MSQKCFNIMYSKEENEKNKVRAVNPHLCLYMFLPLRPKRTRRFHSKESLFPLITGCNNMSAVWLRKLLARRHNQSQKVSGQSQVLLCMS